MLRNAAQVTQSTCTQQALIQHNPKFIINIPSVEEVPVEGTDLQPSTAADPHDCLPCSWSRKVAFQLSC